MVPMNLRGTSLIYFEVRESLDGSLRVLQDGRIIPSQEAPPKPGTLRRSIPRTNVPDRALNGAVLHLRNGNSTSILETNPSGSGVGGDVIRARHKPNRRQRAWWNAVRDARNRGVSVRGIARELDMSRNTVRSIWLRTHPSWLALSSGPARHGILPCTQAQTDIIVEQLGGHFP